MKFSLKEILSVTLILFSVIDIIGSIPIIIDLKKKGSTIESFKATIVAGILMVAFLFGGQSILKLFGVDVESFAVAGALIIFLIGLEMILGIRLFKETEGGGSGTIVPIAFPLVAGAGTFTTIISLKAEFQNLNIITGILLNLIFVYLVLQSSDWIERKLGKTGEDLLRKVFGIILLAIAIKLFKSNFHLG
jgi:multiple antibiotic resistance protein